MSQFQITQNKFYDKFENVLDIFNDREQAGPMDQSAQSYAFVLLPGYSLVALACAIDVLRAANIESNQELFRWQLVTDRQRETSSSSGMTLPSNDFKTQQTPDVIALCGGDGSHDYSNVRLEKWLLAAARRKVTIGSLSDGAFVVAALGLFAKRRSTIHWKCQSAYRERHPDLDIRSSIFEIDGNRFSCAGGTASLDLFLKLVSKTVGKTVIGRIADNYFHDVIRDDDQVQPMADAFRVAAKSRDLSEAIELMEQRLEIPIPVTEIAQALDISHRQLDRLFQKHLSVSPAEYYRSMRLHRASGLLKQTDMSVGEIAVSCGFHSASHMSKFFARKFGVTPGAYRRRV